MIRARRSSREVEELIRRSRELRNKLEKNVAELEAFVDALKTEIRKMDTGD